MPVRGSWSCENLETPARLPRVQELRRNCKFSHLQFSCARVCLIKRTALTIKQVTGAICRQGYAQVLVGNVRIARIRQQHGHEPDCALATSIACCCICFSKYCYDTYFAKKIKTTHSNKSRSQFAFADKAAFASGLKQRPLVWRFRQWNMVLKFAVAGGVGKLGMLERLQPRYVSSFESKHDRGLYLAQTLHGFSRPRKTNKQPTKSQEYFSANGFGSTSQPAGGLRILL